MLKIIKKVESSDNRAFRYLLELNDLSKVEVSYLKLTDYDSICVSSQVGCFTNCKFCATGKIDFKRNLSPEEITSQVEVVMRDVKNWRDDIKVSFMGQGEPLMNLQNIISAYNILRADRRMRFSLSTVGLVPQILQLINHDTEIRLQISLHASNDEVRNNLIPVNRKYSIKQLIEVGEQFYRSTTYPVCYNYMLINDVNDSIENAEELSALFEKIERKGFFVKLSPFHPTCDKIFGKSDQVSYQKFIDKLRKNNFRVEIFESLGADINAGCGQLRNV
jgi:23S rRNA (adenine2503-C2)-methyltransferase